MGQAKRPALAQPLPLPQTTTVAEANIPAPSLTPDSPAKEGLDGAETGIVPVVPAGTTAATVAATSAAASEPSTSQAVERMTTTSVASQKPSAAFSAFGRQPKAVPQIRSAGSGMFGSRSVPSAPAQLPPALQAGPAPAASAAPVAEPDLAAASRLRAQFTLPFATAPAEGPAPAAKASKRQQPEGQEPVDLATTGQDPADAGAAEGVRAVVDALHADVLPPAGASTSVQPISKRHKGSCSCYHATVCVLLLHLFTCMHCTCISASLSANLPEEPNIPSGPICMFVIDVRYCHAVTAPDSAMKKTMAAYLFARWQDTPYAVVCTLCA